MRLVNTEYNLDLQFVEKNIVTLVIESPDIYLDFLTRLCKQADGGDEFCVLSENDKELKFDKTACILTDLLHIDINDRKLLGKLYQDIEGEVLNADAEQFRTLKTEMERMVLSVCEKSEYSLTYTPEPAISGLFKMYDLRFDTDEDDFCSKIVDAVRIYHRILGMTLFVMVNLRMYLSNEKAENLLKTLTYENINILCIERFEPNKLDIEKHFILDEDLCLIADVE